MSHTDERLLGKQPGDDKLGHAGEQGIAVLIAVVALAIFSIIALYLSLNSVTEVRISDNYESEVRATFAARAGVNHSREILRKIGWNDMLNGPDGTHDSSNSYKAQARTFGFRNPLSWDTARILNIQDPSADVAGYPDDGLINTGKYGATAGTVLIPKTGVTFSAPNPYGTGSISTALYFVKVSDNNGEATEIAGDSLDDPFVDGDNIVVVRSMGVARTITQSFGAAARRNSVAVVESRFYRSQALNLSCPLIIEGDSVNANFNGNPWGIAGGSGAPGVGVIDTNTGNGVHPDQIIRAATGGKGSITGGGLANPSVGDITASVAVDPDKARLMDANYLWDLANNRIPSIADTVYQGAQHWAGGSAPYLGTYDHTKPLNDPSQDPKVIVVNGNLDMSGNMSGGGLLVVTGDLKTNGRLTWDGLILIIGTGSMDAGGLNQGVYGGVFIANVTGATGSKTFGTPTFSMSGNSHIYYDAGTLAMSAGLMPPAQLGYREISSIMDP